MEILFNIMSLKIFVVFHASIHEDCYAELYPDELSCITFFAVNEKLPKQYPTDPKYKIIKEWELPNFDPKLQEQGFCENSAIIHSHLNKLYGPGDRIGFAQYDMYMRRGSIRHLISMGRPGSVQTMIMCPWSLFEGNFPGQMGIFEKAAEDMKSYWPDSHFSKEAGFPMCNTYVIDADLLDRIVPWIIQFHSKIYPECILPPYNPRFGQIACFYEHIIGMVLQALCKDFRPWEGIIHPTTHGILQELKQPGPHKQSLE